MIACILFHHMVTSWHRNSHYITPLLCQKSTGNRWLSLTRGSNVEVWWFLFCLTNSVVEEEVELPVISYTMALVPHCYIMKCTNNKLQNVVPMFYTWTQHTSSYNSLCNGNRCHGQWNWNLQAHFPRNCCVSIKISCYLGQRNFIEVHTAVI